MDVLVLGGGIVGAACAQELARRGHQVTIIDRGEMGWGCSYGNAGWIRQIAARTVLVDLRQHARLDGRLGGNGWRPVRAEPEGCGQYKNCGCAFSHALIPKVLDIDPFHGGKSAPRAGAARSAIPAYRASGATHPQWE